jgi:hypothetical protein
MASFGGLNPHEGGGVITSNPDHPGEFIPSAPLYDQALEHLNVAREQANDRERRIINTIAARIHLIDGDLALAREAARAGLAVGEEPFEALYDASWRNAWFGTSGPGGQGFVFNFVYKDFHDSDPGESNRIPLATKLGSDSTTFYFQNRYTELGSPIPFATWQENELILAEIDLLDGDAGSALSRVNTVRAAWEIGPLDFIDMDALADERRKELWGTGLRLIDQRRLDKWHLGPGTWQYFPIPQAERDINPNIN